MAFVHLRPSEACLDIIKAHEPLRLVAWPESFGRWIIGYGHDKNVSKHEMICEQEASAILALDIATIFRKLRPYLPMNPTQEQLDAAISLTHSIGIGVFRSSPLLHHWLERDIEAAASCFMHYTYRAGGHVEDLVRRRLCEQTLFHS